MATPSEKLAESLEVLHQLQRSDMLVIRSNALTRTHQERLCKNGFLQKVLNGWYIPNRPGEVSGKTTGESTAWYASFWHFCALYLAHLKDKDWCLSPEQSLSLHAENWTVPNQLLVRASRARNNITDLPHNTSLLVVRATLPQDRDIVEKDGLRLFSLPAALIACAPGFYRQQPTDMRAALFMIRDASEVLNRLLEGGHSTIAGRLAGAFRNIGQDKIADEITKTMRAAGYSIREEDPFESNSPLILTTEILATGEASPIVNRIHLMWQAMRPIIIKQFPPAPGITADIKTYMKHIEDVYVTDAYHSLSIEGYRVSAELIERVRSGNWNPDLNENDREHRNALAARGYWLAHNAVRESIKTILQGHNEGNNAGTVADENHRDWYRELFMPGVTAGILQAADLAGYRNAPVYIRRSAHVPPRSEVVLDAMSALFNCLREETEACVRVVLGHFIFVYIHPYMDGNGRIGRFMMNIMLASGGYTWCIVPVEQRNAYMAALESASVDQNIKPFAVFLSRLITTKQNTSIP